MLIKPFLIHSELSASFKELIRWLEQYDPVKDIKYFYEEFEKLCTCRVCGVSGVELGEKLHFHHVHKINYGYEFSRCHSVAAGSVYVVISEGLKTVPLCRSHHSILENNPSLLSEWTKEGYLYSMMDEELTALWDMKWLLRKSPMNSAAEQYRLIKTYPGEAALIADLEDQIKFIKNQSKLLKKMVA